jgi:septal ring factor EnvC (AmiA/AmiB activator)
MIQNYRIKTWIVLGITLIAFLSSAEEPINTSPTMTTVGSDELTQSFQREYTYLISQKSALTEQKKKLEKSLNQKIDSIKQQTAQAQKNLVWLSAENDESHEYLLNLERRKKDLQKREFSLESVFKKAQKSLSEFKTSLYFEMNASKGDESIPV